MDSSPPSRKTVILGQGCTNPKRWRLERSLMEPQEGRWEEIEGVGTMEIDSENVKKRRKMEKKDTKEGDGIQTNTMSHHVSNNLLSWIPMAIGQVIQPSHWPNLNVSHHVSDNLLGYQWWLGKLFNSHTDPIPMCHTMWVTTCLDTNGDWASYSTLTLTRSQCVTPCEQRLGWLVIG